MNILICQLLLLTFGESLFVYRCQGYKLLSKNRNATLSGQYNKKSPAYKAVDGDFRKNWPHVAATTKSSSVYWYVDLGAQRNIHSVVIYYRREGPDEDDKYRKRFAGFSLYISDDTNFTSGHNCGVNSTYPPFIYHISCQYMGQYVTLYNSDSDGLVILELAEVQVFGCLSPTKYGANCGKRCSKSCQNRHCNIIDGNCFSCATGYVLVNGSCVCGNNTYGPACEFQCGKCKNGKSCNSITGKCTNGCAEEFYPPMCYMGILSQGKEAFMSPSFEPITTAGKAVDGSLNQTFPNMAVTEMSTSVYWYVDLGTPANIYNVKIYYRDKNKNEVDTYRKRFDGFSLYISDDKKKRTGYKCPVNSTYPPLIYNIKCQHRGRYVKLYNNRSNEKAILEFGEVRVFGCLSSKIDERNCENSCSSQCKDQQCEAFDEECLSCPAGYRGDLCDQECSVGRYGKGCADMCSNKCANGTCNRFNGRCSSGCIAKYYGLMCNTECPESCKSGVCDQITGNCKNGCFPGYYGKKCNRTCTNCLNGVCEQNTGQCARCKYGYFGLSHCKHECSGNCKDNVTCNSTSGFCDNGCVAGYKKDKCDEECEDFEHGPNCKLKCGTCRDKQTCNKISGECTNGCHRGYQGPFCNTTCGNGLYGYDCNETCIGHCKSGTICNATSGYCDDGCDIGYQGDKCTKECYEGKYGHNCKEVCSPNCKTRQVCHHTTGLCTFSCKDGFYGGKCQSNCSGNCLDSEFCNKTTGDCDNGCAGGWTSSRCNETVEQFIEEKSSSPVGKVAGIVAAIVIVIALGVIGIWAFIKLRRRRKKTDRLFKDIDNEVLTTPFTEQPNVLLQSEGTHGNLYVNSVEMNINDGRSPSDETYYNMTDSLNKANGDVKIEELCNVIQNKSRNGNELFSRECKNMDGERVYIASQGPKPNTLTDFWRMVWQERVVKIVMLTNLVEGIKKKCDKYWPDSGEVMKEDNFVIQLQEEKLYASYIIRTFMVTNKRARQDRIVLHFHFTQWPDHGVPDVLNLVIFFRHVIRTTTIEIGKYTVVHCSAGLGRTGTYIALDALYQYGEKTGTVNVPNYVRIMREDRMSMVQNEDQYKTVYNALYEAFRGQPRLIPKEDFLNEFEKQTNSSTPVNISYLRTSFNELNILTPSYTKSDFASGEENIDANFTKKVLPVEKFRCNLYSYAKGRGSYYNAVHLESYSMKDGLISAQFPLPDYTEDFLRLIDDFEADTVVFVNPLSQIKSTNVWLPVQGKPRNVGTYTVSMDFPPACTNNVKRTSLVLMKEESEGHNIDVFEPVSWNMMKPIPSDPRVVLDLVTQVQDAQTSKINKTIIVLSADGAGGCGVFCSVFNALKQLSLDSEVDMFTIVRKLKICRPEMISNTEEYQFCFKAVAAHLKDDAIYANC